MQTQWDTKLEELNRRAEKLQEQIGLISRLRDLELEVEGKATAPVVVTPSEPVPGQKRRGRPPGVKKAITADGNGKTADLPTLLETIGQNSAKPMVIADFVTQVREAKYESKAVNFGNMVYQALLKLVKKGKFRKNDETRAYEYVKAA